MIDPQLVRFIGIPLLALLGLVCMVAWAAYRSVKGMESPDGRLEPCDLPPGSVELDAAAEVNEWAETHGFEWLGAYRTRFPNNPDVFAGAWQRADGTYLTLSKPGRMIVNDLFTIGDEERGIDLSTGNAAGIMMFPSQPGCLKQLFPGAPLDDLIQIHDDTFEFLAERLGLHPIRPEAAYEEVVLRCIRDQAAFIRAHHFWPFRAVLWYAVRKRHDGVPVTQRHASITPENLTA